MTRRLPGNARGKDHRVEFYLDSISWLALRGVAQNERISVSHFCRELVFAELKELSDNAADEGTNFHAGNLGEVSDG